MTYNKTKEETQWYYIILRAQLHKTIEEVASECGVSSKTVYRFERHDYKRESTSIKKVRLYYLLKHQELVKEMTNHEVLQESN